MSNSTNNNKEFTPDPLGFNVIGAPLTAGVFTVTVESILERLTSLAQNSLGNVQCKIDSWVDDDVTSYNEVTKRHESPIRVSFQVWIKKNNPNIIKDGEGNDFVDSVRNPSESLKTFIKTYCLDSDNDIKTLLHKKGGMYVLLVDPRKLMSILFDKDGEGYNDAVNDEEKIERNMDLRVIALYNNEDPIKVLRGSRIRREKPELTGFLVIKTYAKNGGFNNGTFRPAYNTHRDRDDRDNYGKKKSKDF